MVDMVDMVMGSDRHIVDGVDAVVVVEEVVVGTRADRLRG